MLSCHGTGLADAEPAATASEAAMPALTLGEIPKDFIAITLATIRGKVADEAPTPAAAEMRREPRSRRRRWRHRHSHRRPGPIAKGAMSEVKAGAKLANDSHWDPARQELAATRRSSKALSGQLSPCWRRLSHIAMRPWPDGPSSHYNRSPSAAPDGRQVRQRAAPVSDILRPELPAPADAARARMTAAYCRDETAAMNALVAQAALPPDSWPACAPRPTRSPRSNPSCANTTSPARKACC